MYITKENHRYSECCKKVVCRPEIGPKHIDKLKPEPRPDLQLLSQVAF